MKHKPAHGGHQIDKQARHRRKFAKRKLLKGLTSDPRSGYKGWKKHG